MARSIMTPVLPGTVWKRRKSVRKIIDVSKIEVTYEQLTDTTGPGHQGERRTVGRATFYNWVREAVQRPAT